MDTLTLVAAFERLFETHAGMVAAANLRRIAQQLDADPAMTDLRWRAYALATISRECGMDFQVRSEIGSLAYLSKYEPGTPLGERLGNTRPGDGNRFKGRGYVQITGRANYGKFAALLNVDLVGNPDLALDPIHAYEIMSKGMTRGLFTGVGLARYINETKCDYVNARKIINGLDHAQVIAASAVKFQECLELARA